MSKGNTCERCGEALKPGREKWLELSLTDGNYYDVIPKGHESQGAFPFGIKCATKELKDTIKKIKR